jgi:hypothetical protein
MSSREKYIQAIRTARTHQVKWANQVKLLVSGVTVEKDAIPVEQTESEFGKWLYGEAMIFSTTSAKNVIEEMIETHAHCYDIYLKIYATLFSGQKNGIMAIFGSKKASANDLKLAQNYYEELLQASDQLLSRLRVFESVMLALPETKFDEMILTSAGDEFPQPLQAAAETEPKQKLYFRGQLIEE